MKSKRKTDAMAFVPCDPTGKVAALYVRVSQDEEVKTSLGKVRRASVKTQMDDLKAHAKAHGWDYAVYDEDCNISGYEDELARPSLSRLSQDIRAGKVHTIVVRELKRLARNSYLQAYLIHQVCYPHGVQIVGTMEHIDIASSDGLLLAGIKGHMNQEELRYTAERSMRSKQSKLEAGTMRTTPPYGYGIREEAGIRSVFIVKKEAAIIRKLFKMYVDGNGLPTIMSSRGCTTRRTAAIWGRLSDTKIPTERRSIGPSADTRTATRSRTHREGSHCIIFPRFSSLTRRSPSMLWKGRSVPIASQSTAMSSQPAHTGQRVRAKPIGLLLPVETVSFSPTETQRGMSMPTP